MTSEPVDTRISTARLREIVELFPASWEGRLASELLTARLAHEAVTRTLQAVSGQVVLLRAELREGVCLMDQAGLFDPCEENPREWERRRDDWIARNKEKSDG